jgi:1-deoxy-D-xylulose-5-phosphate reductoisomerase
MKKILLLGSTGSIGVNVLNVVKNFPDKFRITALTVNTRIDLLEPQIKEFSPEVVVVTNTAAGEELKKRINNKCKVYTGVEGLCRIAAETDYDIFVGAMVGSAGLLPTVEAVKRGKRIALANKETLVVAGELITSLAKTYNSEIIPIDSEHSAIFQCIVGEKSSEIEKLILTASGGPFLKKNKEELNRVTVKEALNHPNWSMGNKITIDSASLMNKGLEIIEAQWLFGLHPDKIEVLVHPQSIIHSMVQFIDGSIKAQLGLPDMKLPIQYALTYPERMGNGFERTKLAEIGKLTFEKPDMDKFECLKLAYYAMEQGGTAPCTLNAANEVAVDKFLKGEINFNKIPVLISKALEKIKNYHSPDLKLIFDCDRETRDLVMNLN